MEKYKKKVGKNMWTSNQEYLTKNNLPGMTLKKSGCFECKIERAELFKADDSRAEALILTLKEIEEEKVARISLWYKKKNGEEIDFNISHLNQLTWLLKIKQENLKTELDDEGKMIFPMMKNRTIGVMLSYLGLKDSINKTTGELEHYPEYNLRNFYNTKNKSTTSEILANADFSKAYSLWEKNFENENKIREKKENALENTGFESNKNAQNYQKSKNPLRNTGFEGNFADDDQDFPF